MNISNHKDLKNIYIHMRELGLQALKHSVYHAYCFSEENSNWQEFSVLQAAHASELLIKARIAEEHPLLIFEDLPKSRKSKSTKLDLNSLFEDGRTYQFQDLPERLWATTGIKIVEEDLYRKFGKLRNTIQHFVGPSDKFDTSQETLKFIFNVIDPFISECWGLCAVDFNEDPEPYEYLVPILINRNIYFNVSEELKAEIGKGYIQIEWLSRDSKYTREMKKKLGMNKNAKN